MSSEDDPSGTWVRGGERPVGAPTAPAPAPAPATASTAATAGQARTAPGQRPAAARSAPSLAVRRGLVALAILLVAGTAFAGGWFARTSPAPPPTTSVKPPPVPFAVTGISVHLGPGRLTCPRSVAHLSASLRVDRGGGSIVYQWLLPSHVTTSPAAIALQPGQTTALVKLAYTLTGRGALTGTATLRLIAPIRVYSPAVVIRYLCAATPKAKAPAK